MDLGLTPKEQSLLVEIRKRKSELLVEIQVQNYCKLNLFGPKLEMARYPNNTDPFHTQIFWW